MEFTNDFTVPVDLDRAFTLLTDLERVAPCLPGATLEEVDGRTYTGKVKVKVGPIQVTYRGTAEVTEQDAEAKRAVIDAAGKEARGAGTATAKVTARLSPRDDGSTGVTVVTDLTITGKPAQFGRGVMADVGTKLIDTFAARVAEMLEAEEAGAGEPVPSELPPATEQPQAATPAPETAGHDAAEGAPTLEGTPHPPPPAPSQAGPRRLAPPLREPEPLDLVEVAGGAVTKRLVPLVAVVVALLGLVWWWRRRGG